jgi:hypothetical protein
LPADQPRQHGATSWADIISTIKTIRTKEDPNWHVVYKLLQGLYEDHTTIHHPKMFGRWRLGVANKVEIDQDSKSALNRPLLHHYWGVGAKGPGTDVLTKQIKQKFEDIIVAGIRRATLGSCGNKLLVGKPQKLVKWKIVGSYTGGQDRWFLASKVDSGDATVTTEDMGQLTMGQETMHQEGMGGPDPSRPEGTFDWLVCNDAYFANTRALWNEHPDVLAKLLGVKNRPMTEIVTVEEDLGTSTMTNRRGETALVKRRRVDGCEEEVDDGGLVRTEQAGRGNKSISSTTGEEGSQPGGGRNSAVDGDKPSPQEEEPDESNNTALLEALEQEEANEQERKENTGEERTTAKLAVDETMQDGLRFFCDSLDELADEPTKEECGMVIAGE